MPYCPNCKYDYVDGIKTCPDCYAELLPGNVPEQEPETPLHNADDYPVEVYAAKNAAEAEIVGGMLEDAGIMVWVKTQAVKRRSFTEILSTDKVYVPASRAAEALQLIQSVISENE